MKLPNANSAIVDHEKITEYLLNPAHRYGSSKARFFRSFGFNVETWQTLANALRNHGARRETARVTETGFGPRYQIDGELEAPDGRRPMVRTVWQHDHGQLAPRLITAYPPGTDYD
jgi:hypothetical protein